MPLLNFYLGRNLVSWSSKNQQTVARSSTKAEYRSIAATTAELRWVCSLLSELGIGLPNSPLVYCNNVGATQLSSNPIFHSRMNTCCCWLSFYQRSSSIWSTSSSSCLLCWSACRSSHQTTAHFSVLAFVGQDWPLYSWPILRGHIKVVPHAGV